MHISRRAYIIYWAYILCSIHIVEHIFVNIQHTFMNVHKWVMSHDSWPMTRRNMSKCDVTHKSWRFRNSFISSTWHTTSLMTHSYELHDAFIGVTWPIHACDMTHTHKHDQSMWHDSLMGVTWLTRVRVTWRVRVCDRVRAHVQHYAYMLRISVWWIHVNKFTHIHRYLNMCIVYAYMFICT